MEWLGLVQVQKPHESISKHFFQFAVTHTIAIKYKPVTRPKIRVGELECGQTNLNYLTHVSESHEGQQTTATKTKPVHCHGTNKKKIIVN